MTRSGSPIAPRAQRRLRRWAPLLLGALTLGSLLLVWELGLAPLLPENPGRVEHLGEGSSWQPPDRRMVLYSEGDPHASDLLVVGDSRVFHGIVDRCFVEAGLGRTVVFWGQGAQLLEQLALARDFGPRRLLVHLDPTAVYAEAPPAALAAWEARDEEPAFVWRPSEIDERLDRWMRRRRGHNLTTLSTSAWHTSWLWEMDPNAHDRIMKRRLRPATRAARERALLELRCALAGLREDGWEIVAFRLPISPSLADAEESGFPAIRFHELCEDLQIPYLDHLRDPVDTTDGSHLTIDSAKSVSPVLAGELRSIWKDGCEQALSQGLPQRRGGN